MTVENNIQQKRVSHIVVNFYYYLSILYFILSGFAALIVKNTDRYSFVKFLSFTNLQYI